MRLRALRDRIDRIEVSAAPRAIGDPAPAPRWEGLAGVEGIGSRGHRRLRDPGGEGRPRVSESWVSVCAKGWLDLPPREKGGNKEGTQTGNSH